MTEIQGALALIYFVVSLGASITIWVYLLDWRLPWSAMCLVVVSLAGGFGSTLALGLLAQLIGG